MILITGATSGIGEATARAFARDKQNLMLIGRRGDRLARLTGELTETHGIHCLPVALDVRETATIESWARAHSELLAEVTVLVNNAGLALGMEPFQSLPRENWEAMIDTNFKGLVGMTQALLPHFLKRGSGHIVNMGSVAGSIAYPKGNIYCATKAAVRSFTQTLRLDLNGSGVRVTEISPGMVETEFSVVRFGDAEKAKAVYAGMKPLTAEDIADAVFWCVSRPAHVNIQEVVLYPTDQASPTVVSRKSP